MPAKSERYRSRKRVCCEVIGNDTVTMAAAGRLIERYGAGYRSSDDPSTF